MAAREAEWAAAKETTAPTPTAGGSARACLGRFLSQRAVRGAASALTIWSREEKRSPRVHVSRPEAGDGASRGGRERRPAVASTRGRVRGRVWEASGGTDEREGRRRGKGEEGERRALAGLPASSRRRPGPQATAPRPRADAGRSPPPNPPPRPDSNLPVCRQDRSCCPYD